MKLQFKRLRRGDNPSTTVRLPWAFKVWGPSILTARLVAAGFGLMLFAVFHQLWARGSLLSSWRSHFDESAVPGLGSPADYPFNSSLLTMHLDCLVAAAAGLAWAVASKRWREVAFPGILLLPASFIHCVHRPWWNYYCPFHARLPPPPEFAVVVAKRLWSGQIGSEAILAACKRYRPEQILLSNRLVSGDWKKFLDAGYTLACADQTSLLDVAKALIPPGAPP
jgi:hypothetical protein